MKVDLDRSQDVSRTQVIASGELWDYLVDGSDPGASWASMGFSVASPWNIATDGTVTGPVVSPIGYGEAIGINSLATDVGQPVQPRPLAYFFRHEFDLSDPTSVVDFELRMKVDDGAVVYLNGVEVVRLNMPMDVVATFETAATGEISNERDWQRLFIGCMDAIDLMETGNVLAVSIHQANSGSSDIRMDVDLVAIYASPDEGAVIPTTPTGLTHVTADFVSVLLIFDAQDDAKYFRIERQLVGDLAWETIERALPGDLNTFLDTTVSEGQSYNYRMSAYSTGGHSACSAEAMIMIPQDDLPILFLEDFEVSDSFGKFTPVDVAEPEATWSWVTWDFGTTGAVQGNGVARATVDRLDLDLQALGLDLAHGGVSLAFWGP